MRALRLNWGKLYAYVMPAQRGSRQVWLYCVRRVGSADLIRVGTADNREAAEKDATDAMHQAASSIRIETPA